MLSGMDVTHNHEQNRFEVSLEDGTAELSYTREPSGLNITHTYVPDAARGQGVAGRMMRAALEYARKDGLEVVPICSYAAAYLARQKDKHSESA